MYLLGVRLFRASVPAWVCGAFYAFAAPALALALRNPDTGATEWQPGVAHNDRITLQIPCAIAGGKYLLLIGMKDSMTGEALEIRHADGNPIGSLHYLTTLQLRAS